MQIFLAKNRETILRVVRSRRISNTHGYDHEDLFAEVVGELYVRFFAKGLEPRNLSQTVHWLCGECLRKQIDPSGVGLTGWNPSRTVEYSKLAREGISKKPNAPKGTSGETSAYCLRESGDASDTPQDAPTALDLVEKKELLEQALEALEPYMRARVRLLLEGYTAHEVAAMCGVSPNVITQTLKRAVSKLTRRNQAFR